MTATFEYRVRDRAGRRTRAGHQHDESRDTQAREQAGGGNEQGFDHPALLARFLSGTKNERLTHGFRTIKSRAWPFATF